MKFSKAPAHIRGAIRREASRWETTDGKPLTDLLGIEVVEAKCPACGSVIDYCQGHGEIGDPAGFAILQAHDDGDHSGCWQHAGECIGA